MKALVLEVGSAGEKLGKGGKTGQRERKGDGEQSQRRYFTSSIILSAKPKRGTLQSRLIETVQPHKGAEPPPDRLRGTGHNKSPQQHEQWGVNLSSGL